MESTGGFSSVTIWPQSCAGTLKERDSQFFALDDTCNYRGGPLADGQVSGCEVTCPWHRATFDVQTVEVVGPGRPSGAVVRYGVL